MLCQNCNEKEATVQLTKIVNGEKTELHLCEDCASKEAFNLYQADFAKFLSGFMNIEKTPQPQEEAGELLRCPVCGRSLDEFKKSAKLGCDACYSAFGEQIEPLLKRIHGRTVHTGKIAKTGGKELKVKREISELQKNLEEAIGNENYELAAEYRDIIRLLKDAEETKQKSETGE